MSRILQIAKAILFIPLCVLGLVAFIIGIASLLFAFNNFALQFIYYASFALHMMIFFILIFIAKIITMYTHRIQDLSDEPVGDFLPDAISAIKFAALISMTLIIVFMVFEPAYHYFVLGKSFPDFLEPVYNRRYGYYFSIEIFLFSHHVFYFFVMTPVISIIIYFIGSKQFYYVSKIKLFLSMICLPFIFFLVYTIASYGYLAIWPSMAQLSFIPLPFKDILHMLTSAYSLWFV
jgi:hypothetical protein